MVVPGTLRLFLTQNFCNFIGTVSLGGKPEDPAYNRSRFLVDYPVILVGGVFPISVNRAICGVLPGFPLMAKAAFTFLD